MGASGDSEAANERFRIKHNLPYSLLCDDDDRLLCKVFGAWQKKKMAGREYMGIVRSSFLVGADGTVEKVFPKVRAAVHPQQVLDFLEGEAE